ncbi:MAG: DMT family transporter [Pseudomonadota bacterium]
MSPLTGIALKLASVVMFIAMSSFAKVAAETMPPGQTVFFRSLFAFPAILIWLAMRGELSVGLRTDRPLGHLWRGLIGGTAMGLMFMALGLLPLPEVTAIFYATPIFVTVFAAMFLGERIRVFRVSVILLGLVGVGIVMQPRLTGWSSGDAWQAIGAMAVFVATIFAALAQITVRHLTKTEHVAAIVFYFTATTTFLSLLTAPFGWVWPTPDLWFVLLAMGLVGGVAQILLTASFRYADAAVIASFEFMSIIMALVVGYVIFAEIPTTQMLIGSALVVVAGLAMAWRERQLQLQRAYGVKLVK